MNVIKPNQSEGISKIKIKKIKAVSQNSWNSWSLIGQKKGRTSFWLDLNHPAHSHFHLAGPSVERTGSDHAGLRGFLSGFFDRPLICKHWICTHTLVSISSYFQKRSPNFGERAVFVADRGCQTCQGSTNCSILPSRMGKHGVSWENMENIENMEKINQMT